MCLVTSLGMIRRKCAFGVRGGARAAPLVTTLRACVYQLFQLLLLSCRCDGVAIAGRRRRTTIVRVRSAYNYTYIFFMFYIYAARPALLSSMCSWCVHLGRSMGSEVRHPLNRGAPGALPSPTSPPRPNRLGGPAVRSAGPATCKVESLRNGGSCRGASGCRSGVGPRRRCAASAPPCSGWRSRGRESPATPGESWAQGNHLMGICIVQ